MHGGQEALDAARKFKPHVVMLDIGMPRSPATTPRGACASATAPIGSKQASDKMLANLAGFDYHVAKPYDPNDLVRLLAKVRPAAR